MKLTKRILASVLATACAVSSLSLASLADEPGVEAAGEMKLGLNATFYQTKGERPDGGFLADLISRETGVGRNDHNHGSNEGAAIEDDDRRFDENMAVFNQYAKEVKTDLDVAKIGDLANAGTLGVGDDGYWAHMTGDITLEAGSYQFGGKFDNGLVIELTKKDDAEATPIRVFEFWGNGSWADAGDFGVLDDAKDIAAGEYKIDVYYLEYWGGNGATVKVKKDDGDFVLFDEAYTIANPSTDVFVYYGFKGDYDQLNAKLEDGGGENQRNYDENKRQYDETIDDIMGIVYKAGEKVLPSPTVNNFNPDSTAVGCDGDNSILVDYDGYITATEDGTYQFGLRRVDNAAVVTVGETRVVEYWARHAWVGDGDEVFYDAPTVELKAGEPVKLNVKYLELDGGDALQIYSRKVTVDEDTVTPVEGSDNLIDANFIFTQTADVDFDVAKAAVLYGPALEDVAEGDKAIFDGFKNLEGVENNGVVVDEETGIATFDNKGTNIVLPEYITKQINTSSKLVVEAVFKKSNDPAHGYIASVGTSTDEGDNVQTALMGMREGWRVKTIGSNDDCPRNALRYKRWATVKWVYDETGSKVYVDGEKVIDNNKVVKLAEIEGNFKINHCTNTWDDDGIVGQMSQFRITIDDYNPAEITELKVKDLPATLGEDDTFTVNVPLAEGETLTTEDIAIATIGSNATGDKVDVAVVEDTEDGKDDVYTYNITVTANDDETLTKNYKLVADAHIPSTDATIKSIKVNDIEATLVVEAPEEGTTPPEEGTTPPEEGTTPPEENTTTDDNVAVVADTDTDVDTSIKYTASVYKATAYDVTAETNDEAATYEVETVEAGKTYKVTVTAEDKTTTQVYTVDITTDKSLADENGVIYNFPASGFAKEGNGDAKKWDGDVAKELDENGNLKMPAGNSGNFWGAYWHDVRPVNAILPQGVYKVVYLFDVAENSGTEMQLKVFQSGGDADVRTNEIFSEDHANKEYSPAEWEASVQGNKVAISTVFATKEDHGDFEIGGWKGGNFAGTLNGVVLCTADTDVAAAFPEYKLVREGAPKGMGNVLVAEEGTYTPSTLAKSANAAIKGLKVNGIEAVKGEDGKYTASVCKATKYTVTVDTDSAKATFGETTDVTAEDAATGTKTLKVTVTAEDGETTQDYTVDITTDKALKGVIAEVKPSADGTWDDNKAKELDDNGNLVLKEGESGNYAQTNLKDVANNVILPQGAYKVVYLYDIAENSTSETRFVPFIKDGKEADYRPNENFSADQWNNVKGKKAAFVFVVKTTQELEDFTFNAWKSGGLTGTFNGIVVCTADTNIRTLCPDYEIAYEGNPKYPAEGFTVNAADDEFMASHDISNNTDIASVKVNGVAATVSGTTYTAEVTKAAKYEVVVTTADKYATATYDEATKTITVKAEDGETTATYTVVIKEKAATSGNNNNNNNNNNSTTKPKVVAVSKVSLSKTKATLVAGKSVTLRATVTPSNATDKKVTWKSSNTKVATVSSTGKVTAKGVGTAKITAKAGSKTVTCTVTVKPGKVTKLKVSSPKKKTLKITFKKGAKASATKLVICRGTKKVKTVNTSKTSVTVKNLKAGKYTVKAYATKKVSKKTYTSDPVKNKKAVKVK